MNNFSLIKKINESVRDTDPVDVAIAEADRKMTDELERIVNHYVEQCVEDDCTVDENEIRELIATDLEMLEYSPSEVERVVPHMVTLVKERVRKAADSN